GSCVGAGRGLLQPCAEHGRLPIVRDSGGHSDEAGGDLMLGAEDGAQNRRAVPVRDHLEQRTARRHAQHDQGAALPAVWLKTLG
ncbi:non-specific lipid-transfer protein-like protein at5g64080, partial [Phtheirospermum japonicum]